MLYQLSYPGKKRLVWLMNGVVHYRKDLEAEKFADAEGQFGMLRCGGMGR